MNEKQKRQKTNTRKTAETENRGIKTKRVNFYGEGTTVINPRFASAMARGKRYDELVELCVEFMERPFITVDKDCMRKCCRGCVRKNNDKGGAIWCSNVCADNCLVEEDDERFLDAVIDDLDGE